MLKKLGSGKKPSLTAMLDEIDRAIEMYPRLESKGLGRKSEIEHRVNIMRWVRQSLQWLEENETDARLFVKIAKLNPGAMQKLLDFVQAQQALIEAEKAVKDAA